MRFAVDVADGDRLVEFPLGTPKDEREQFRERAKGRLRCVVPECRAPLTGAFREGTKERPRRPGFQHLSGTGHENEPERVAHQMAKAMVAHWAREQHRDLVVELEKATPGGSRRPDVTIVGTSGHRVYVEVQYSDLTAADWEKRQADLTRDGSTAVWLLGHLPPHFRRTQRGTLAIGKLVQTMCAAGVIPLWIDPVRQEIITAWVRDDEFGPVAPTRATAADQWDFLPMAQCTLTRDGIMTPDLEHLIQAEARRRPVIAQREAEARAREEERRQEAAARLHESVERLRKATELADRRREEAAELDERRRQEASERERVRAARESAWESSALLGWVLDRHGGRMPPFISDPVLPHDQHLADLLGLSRQHWKAVVYEVAVAAAGEAITWDALLEHLARGRPRVYGDGRKALREVLRRMERAGVLELEHAADQLWKIEAIRTPAPPPVDVAAPVQAGDSATTRPEAPPSPEPQDDKDPVTPGRVPVEFVDPQLRARLAGAAPSGQGPSSQIAEEPAAGRSLWTRMIRRMGLLPR